MRWLQVIRDAWQLLFKDLILTGLGMLAIYSQIFSPHPNGLLLGVGLALTVPSIADHVRALLPSSGGGSGGSSSPSLPPGTSRPRALPPQPNGSGESEEDDG